VEGRKLYEYKMATSDGATKDEGIWTPEEIKEAIDRITAF
jgi:hypothetical protein